MIDLGFDVEHAKNVGSKGKPDKEIARYAKEQDGVLVTKDLGNIPWYDEKKSDRITILIHMVDLYRLIIIRS